MSLILKYDLGNPHRLPVGYTPLAYIESTGTQYINTGWVPGVDSKIDTTIIPSDNSALSPANPITCIYTSDNKLIFEYFINKNEQTLYYSVNGVLGTSTNGNKSVSDGKFIGPLHCVYTTDKFICNGETLVSSSKPTIETSYNCYIFAYNNKGTIDSRHIACKLYSFKGFDNNTLVRDFIPARRNSDGIIGLFDCVSQTFFTNQGTGAFIAGPEIVVLPYEYLQVEYLKNIGSSYIIFNRELLANDILEVKASVLSRSGTQDTLVGGGTLLVFMNSNTAISYWKSDTIEAVTPNAGTSITFNNRYNFKSKVKKTISSNYGIFAFSSGNYPIKSTIELVLITRNDQPIANIIPCYRRSDMKPGMYDLVNKVFYTNAGTEEFVLGPTVEESSRQLEYNNAEQPNHFTNWRTASNWTSDGATVTLAGSYVQIAFSGGGNNRSYILSNNLWTTVGAKYLVSGWIRTTSGTSTVRFSRQIADYGDIDISANTNWTNFSTVITTTATSNTGSLSIQGTANTTIQLDNFKVIPITNSYTAYKGIPYNVHYSTSNPASNLVNCGSGKFVRSEKSMITTEALGISGDANFSISAWVKTVDAITDYVGVVANSTYSAGKCFSLLLYSNKPDLDFWTGSGTDGGSRFIATNAISTGEWHHIVATKAAGVPSTSNCKLYVDGVAVSGSVVGTLAPNITNSPIIIGRLNDNTNRYFNGEIYDVRIYDNILTADEVLQIYKGGL